MPRSAAQIDAAFGDLPLDDRVAALVVSMVTRRPEAMLACVSLLSLVSVLASEMSLVDRVTLAELARDAADHVEHRRELVHV